MHLLRKSILTSAATMFVVTLSLFGLLWGIERVLGTPNSMKHALKASGTYDHVVSNALDRAQRESSSDLNTQDIPVSDPEVRKIISQAFPPELLQQQTEQALDAVYNWLRGITPNLALNLNLDDAKTKLADGVGQYTQQRLSKLPACSASDMMIGQMDVFKATCVPPGFDIAAAAAHARQEILDSEFLKDTHFDTSDLKTKSGKPFTEEYHQVPSIYRLVTGTVYGMLAVALVLGIAIIFLAQTRRLGLRKVAIMSLIVGIFLVIDALCMNFFISRIASNYAHSSAGSDLLQQNGIKIAQLIAADIRNWWLIFGLGVAALSTAGLLALYVTKPKAEAEPSYTPNQDEQKTDEPTKKPKEKPAKKLVR